MRPIFILAVVLLVTFVGSSVGTPVDKADAPGFRHHGLDGHDHSNDAKFKHHPLDGHDHTNLNYEDYQVDPGQPDEENASSSAAHGVTAEKKGN